MTDSDEPENPPAFPDYRTNNGAISYHQDGMTLRDYFAGEALSAMDLGSSRPRGIVERIKAFFGFGYTGTSVAEEDAAESAYEYADAMLEVREEDQ